ncbi:hypothetical protein [uncultured Roseovarius sp.]|uniref:hypothetical protein n=1 Tax=uncultured Roseovarius sp. TaxID=293344 RepID=UPI00263252AE|nr:hypothetical protein [uncultured Roseovarius sp.]
MGTQSIESFKTAVQASVADIDLNELRNGAVPRQKESVVVRLKAGSNYFKRIYSRLVKSDGKNTHFDSDRETMVTEMNFFRDRDAETQEAAERLIACDLIVAEKYSLERLLDATDQSENYQLYEELSVLENIRNSQLATLSFKSGKGFEHQIGPVRLALGKFLLIKTRLCYSYKGIKLNRKNYEEHYLDHTEIRLDDIERRMHQLFNEARAVGEHNPEAFEIFKTNVAALTAENTEPEVSLPTKAPELYKERKDRSEKPETFLARVYEGLTGTPERPAMIARSHIKSWDKSLYDALYKRRKIIDNFEFLLPSSQGRSVEDFNKSPAKKVEKQREASRNSMSRLRATRKDNKLN